MLAAWLHNWCFPEWAFSACLSRPSCRGPFSEWLYPQTPSCRALPLWVFPFRGDRQASLSYPKQTLLMLSYFCFLFWFESTGRIIQSSERKFVFQYKYVFSLLLKNGYKAIYLSVGKECFSRDSAVFHKVYESGIITGFVQRLSVTFSSCDPLWVIESLYTFIISSTECSECPAGSQDFLVSLGVRHILKSKCQKLEVTSLGWLSSEEKPLDWSSGQLQEALQDFPGGALVENPPASAGGTGSIPGLGRSHMPQSNQTCGPQLLSPCTTTAQARSP